MILKQQRKTSSFVILVVLLISIFQVALCQDELNLILEKEQIGKIEEGNKQLNYILKLDKPQRDDQYLIITAQGTFEGSEPDIYINTKGFDTSNKSKIICKSYGFALCYVKSNQIDHADKLFVSVKCESKCEYEINAFLEEVSSQIDMRLNDITYGIFEDSKGNTKDKKMILEKVVQMKFDKSDLLPDETLDNLLIEFELMNPVEQYTTFNVYFNFNDQIPSRSRCHSWGLNWGSGAGMGVFVQSKKSQSIPESGIYTMTIEAHEGSIIAIRAHGWGEVRYIKPYELVGGFTTANAPEMKFSLNLNKYSKKDLIIGLVPFQGDPNLYADFRSFNQLESVENKNYKWVSDELLDDRVIITSKELMNNDTISIKVASSDNFSLFTLRAYYPLGKTPLNFDYPESGNLDPEEIVSYSLSLYGNQQTNVTLTLKLKEGNPGLLMKKCNVDKKDQCQFTDEDYKSMITTKFESEQIVFKFLSNPNECSNYTFEGLKTCYYLIGVRNPDKQINARYSLSASNGVTHTILQEEETYHEGVEFGKINYYMLNLTKYSNVTQVSFQLSNVQGQVSMFASMDNIRPNVNDKMKQSFYHSLHLYTEESGDLNKEIYLGIQSDSSFSSYNLQVKVIEESNFSFYVLEENNPIVVTEDASKVKKIHFKFNVRKSFSQDVKVKVLLEPLSGYYDMKIGLDPQNIDEFESSSNQIEFSTKQVQFERYEQPIYGIITPRMTWLNNKIQFKLSFITGSVVHQTLNLGIVNQIRVSQEEQYFKIPIQSKEQVLISKNVLNQFGDQSDVSVIVSYDQANIKPKKGELNVIELPNFIPQIISEENFKLHCKKIDEFTVDQNNCFLFITVSGKKEALVLIYAEINSNAQYIFSDFPNIISFKPNVEKKLYYPDIFNKQFNLFKTASLNGDELIICAKIFNNTAEKKNWKFPVGCKPGEYDFKFNTQGDENYFYEIKDNNGVCDFAKKECGLSIYLLDSSFSIWGQTDQITLTLQQSHTTLHPNQSIIDTIPPNGSRFYYIELSELKEEKFIIAATEYIDESIELNLYIDTQKVFSTNRNLPYITFDKQFRETLKESYKFNDKSQFGLEVKSRIRSKETRYSILLTISSDQDKITMNRINIGKPLQIQLKDDKEYQYFIFKNKAKGENFKIVLSQQTQGYTLTTVDYLDPKQNEQVPLKKYIQSTYDNVLLIQESKDSCEKQCSYIIQLHTNEKNGATLSLSVQRETITLLENISSSNELKTNEKVTYNFNSLEKSVLTIDVQSGEISIIITDSQGKQITKRTADKPLLYTFELPELQNINEYFAVSLTAINDAKVNIKFVNENTSPQITFDQPLKDQKILPLQAKAFAIQTSGDKLINIQLQFTYEGKISENDVNIFVEQFESNSKSKKLVGNLISQYYDQNTGIYIRHLQIQPTIEMNKILMKIKNHQTSPINNLTIYISQNFTLLDQARSMFYYFDGVNQESNLYGIILPEKNRKIFIEITCLKGDIHAEGTYSRDSALNNNFQFSFSQGYRQTLNVDVSTGNFYIKLKGLEENSQGYIKFVSLPFKTTLPTTLYRKPVKDVPIITGVKSLEKQNEYSEINFQFEPLDCSHLKDLNGFEVKNLQYTMIITKDKQVIYGTDFLFSQIPGDLSAIQQQIQIFQSSQKGSEGVPSLFFSFKESSECYKTCGQCKVKEISIPLDNQTFSKYLEDSTPIVIVRATINWQHSSDNTSFSQNIYYNEFILDKEVVLPPISSESSGGLSTFTIVFIVLSTVVLISLLVFYFKKYKQTEKRLNFELTDVRNIANFSTSNQPIGTQVMKHIPLDEEIQEQ